MRAIACSLAAAAAWLPRSVGQAQSPRWLQEEGAVWEVSADELGPCPEPECGQAETTLTRVVLCMEGGAVVDEADCQADKPAASLVCPATDACVVFSWHADDFAACRTACGTPAETLTRSVRCVGDDDSTGDESSCTGAKPAEALDCDAAAPCTYAWEVVESLCPSECGVAAGGVASSACASASTTASAERFSEAAVLCD